MSERVRRCTECRQVRGMTAFRVLKPCGRHTVCRWCEQQQANLAESATNAIRARIRELRRLEGQYVKRLDDVRTELAARQAELAPQSQPSHLAAHRQSA